MASEIVSIPTWVGAGGVSTAIGNEIRALGHEPVFFQSDEAVPKHATIVFSFAPYGRFMQIPAQFLNTAPANRPVVLHWSTQNPPDPRIPWAIMYPLSAFRAWVDRLNDKKGVTRNLLKIPPFAQVNSKMVKFRYVGENHYTHRHNLVDVFAETSEIYANMHRKHGLPSLVVPWGTAPEWYEDMNLERDIDVLWMGKRRTGQRSRMLDQIRSELRRHDVEMYVADNVDNPFIYGQRRTTILNRSKITLNLLPTWYDNNFPARFHLAAGNRSLVISEPFLPHCPRYEAGVHYVESQSSRLVEAILYYLNHHEEREQIAEAAYQLANPVCGFFC